MIPSLRLNREGLVDFSELLFVRGGGGGSSLNVDNVCIFFFDVFPKILVLQLHSVCRK